MILGWDPRLGVGQKVVLPFVGLTLIVGLIVVAVAAYQSSSAAASHVSGLAAREKYSVDAVFASFEQRQLSEQRALSATQGVARSAAQADVASLQAAAFPVVVNQYPDPIRASIVDLAGRELLRLRYDPTEPAVCICVRSGRDLSGWPHVSDVLAGHEDKQGGKYVGLASEPDGHLLYTIGALRLDGAIVGAVLVGEHLGDLLAELEQTSQLQLALQAPDGTLLAATSGFPTGLPGLDPAVRLEAMTPGGGPHVLTEIDGRQAAVYFVPWGMRGTVLGYAGIVVPADAITAAAGNTAPPLLLIFLAALLLTVLVGSFVTRSVTRPLATLVKATEAVATGDLEHRAAIGSRDEMGRLAASFNAMTASLSDQNRRLEQSAEAAVMALAAALEARDRYTHGHSVRVAAYSQELALALDLDAAAVEAARRGCLVHDIGKIGVPDRILGKTVQLDRWEALQMRRHPEVGYQILRDLPWGVSELAIVRHHHERWDGSGYPLGLAGEQIPVLARLVAIADTLDAMTSDRPYRAAYAFDQAAGEIVAAAGTQFDPELVALFVRSRARLLALFEDIGLPPAGFVVRAS